MFRRLPEAHGEMVAFTIDGKAAQASLHDNVAAALLANGIAHCRRSVVTGEPRAPYCMMGICFECLVVIDDVPNQQACLTLVSPGMRVTTQSGPPALRT